MFFFKELNKYKHIKGAFFSKKNGTSKGIYKSLNCGLSSKDNKKNVLKNRKIALKKIGLEKKKLIIPNQINSNKVIIVNEKSVNKKITADALLTTSNKIVLGNNSISTANIQVDWTVHSDRRDKTDIEPFTHGLSWINKLNPVTYRWDNRSDYENGTPDGTHKKPKLNLGLIAQDEHEVEKEHGYGDTLDNMLVSDLSVDGENYGMKYSKLVPILINAVKELSSKNEALEARLAALESK